MPLQNPCSRVVQRVRAWPRRLLITLAVIVVVLIAARIALPFVVKHRVNQRLAAIPGYWGHVEGIGISLLRGAYSLHDVGIFKVNGAAREPFVAVEHIDFSMAWRELIHRKIVSEIYIDRAEVNFVAAGAASQKDIDRRWTQVIKDLFPIDITYFEVRDSAVRYQDLTKTPHVDVFMKNMHVLASGLRNRPEESGEEFPAEIIVEGDSLGGGKVKLFIKADPLAAQPHFHLSAKVDGVNLPDLNESMRAIANVDVSRGTFRMAAEMAGKDGGFQGYVKPFFEDLDFNNLDDKNKKVLTRIWENVVQGLAWLVKNKARDQVGTRIPFQGRFGDPQVGLWATISNLFRHGFIRAFNPTVEGSVHADNVLPSGDSADGKKVAEKKDDGKRSAEDAKVDAGAPTGRKSERKPKK
jgi:hypothetical protein